MRALPPRRTISGEPINEERLAAAAASLLYSTLRMYRKLEPGDRQETIDKLTQAVTCILSRGIRARGSLPKAKTVAAAIAWNAGCGNSVSVTKSRFGVSNSASVSQIANRIEEQGLRLADLDLPNSPSGKRSKVEEQQADAARARRKRLQQYSAADLK